MACFNPLVHTDDDFKYVLRGAQLKCIVRVHDIAEFET